MQYRELKNLGLNVSILGFGAMRLPRKRTALGPRVDEKKSVAIIRRGIDLGINYLDTAYLYHFGASERIVGQALRDGYREKVYLADKLPVFLVRRPEDFEKLLETQLRRLQTDYLDFYLFHSMNRNYLKKVIDLGLIERMENAKKRGLIKYIGFSFHDTLPVFATLLDLYKWDMAQIQYNYLDLGVQASQEGLRLAYQKGIPVVVMEGLKGGKLAHPPREALAIIRDAPTRKSPVEWAFQFLWNAKEVATVLSGMNSLGVVEENCAYADRAGINALTGEDMRTLEQLAAIYRQKILVDCTACGYCLPCPHGVQIPENFALLNNANGPGGMQSWMITRRYRKLASRPHKVNTKNPDGNASLCTRCGSCRAKCPQEIDIPAELARVNQVMGGGKKINEVFGAGK